MKEIDFEEIFRQSVSEAFESFKQISLKSAVRTGKISFEQSKEYNKYKFDSQLFISSLKQKNQWGNIRKQLFKEDSFVKSLSTSSIELLGSLVELASDGSDENVSQLARNIAKLIWQKLIDKINANPQLFNECLEGELNKLKEGEEEVREVVEVLQQDLNKSADEIITKLIELSKESSKEHAEILVNSKKEHADLDKSIKSIDLKIEKTNELITQQQQENKRSDFFGFIDRLESIFESKTWPDSIREIVLSNIYDVLNEFRNIGEQEVCSFIKAVSLPYFFSTNKSFKLSEHMESVERIIECIALIRIIYPDLKLISKTAQALNVDGQRSVCLIYSDKRLYASTIKELWRYINEKQPDMQNVFRIVVGNQTCTFCQGKGKGANLKDMGLEHCLADFMKVIASDTNKPEYNNLQVNFEQIGFHCEECLGSYESSNSFEQYRETLYSILGKREG